MAMENSMFCEGHRSIQCTHLASRSHWLLNILTRRRAMFEAFYLRESVGVEKGQGDLGGNVNQCIEGAGCSGLDRGRKDDRCLKSYFKFGKEKLIYLFGFI